MNPHDPHGPAEGQAEHTKAKVREQTQDIARQARERGNRFFEEQKHVAADQLTAFAHALHRAGEELDKEGHPSASQYAHWSADGMDRFASTLDEQEPRNLLHRAENFAREQPAIFLGGAVAAGLALAWALKPPGTGISSEQLRRGAERGGEKSPEQVGLPPRAEAEYGELATRKPGSPPRERH